MALSEAEKYRRKLVRKNIVMQIVCKHCGLQHDLKKKVDTYRCKCGKNLIIWCLVNHLNTIVIFDVEKYEEE